MHQLVKNPHMLELKETDFEGVQDGMKKLERLMEKMEASEKENSLI